MSKHGETNATNDSNFAEILDEITIDLKNKCELMPHSAMVEECKLKVREGNFTELKVCNL